MPPAALLLLLASVIYGTSYTVSRVAMADVPPATLALLRLVLGALILIPLAARAREGGRLTRADRVKVFWMGALGFAGAYGLSNWGIRLSTATNAALLIIVEPLAIIVLGALLLGERLTPRGAMAALLALVGAVCVALDGLPGLSATLAPHWRGDLLLVLSGVAFGSYSVIGRDVLRRHPSLTVTAWSVLWGALTMLPLAALEWLDGQRPVVTPTAALATLYLGIVVTGLAYLVWNRGLARIPTPRLAVFLSVQPLVGTALGVGLLGEPLSALAVVGGALILAGLAMTIY